MSATARDVIAMELWRCKDKADAKGNKLTANDFTVAILSAIDAAGFAIVPKEPTTEMINAWGNASRRGLIAFSIRYKAMLTAAKETI